MDDRFNRLQAIAAFRAWMEWERVNEPETYQYVMRQQTLRNLRKKSEA
jgi:hypothetical protein